MADTLVIVESPAKAKTIEKFLGKNFKVLASNGHVRDLPKSQLGVDVEHSFAPKYITLRGRGEVLDRIRREAKNAKKIYLATDPDREGEAISWHLAQILKLDETSKCRIVFNEITSTAVKNSLKNARSVDLRLVDAQQARQLLIGDAQRLLAVGQRVHLGGGAPAADGGGLAVDLRGQPGAEVHQGQRALLGVLRQIDRLSLGGEADVDLIHGMPPGP